MKFIKKDKNMRLFVYKTLFIFICILIVFKLTIGSLIILLKIKLKIFIQKKILTILKKRLEMSLMTS